MNLYTYCNNNPLIYYDPTGHFLDWINWGRVKAGLDKIVTGVFITAVSVAAVSVAAPLITAAGLTLTGITAAGVTAAGGVSIVTNISDAVEGAQELILGVIGKSPEQKESINITRDSWTALGGSEKGYNNIQIASSIASVGGLELFAPYAGSFNTTRNSKVNVNQNNSVKNAGASEVRVPRGFNSAEQAQQCIAELQQALSKSGLDAKSIQVRGSSATGVSRKGGEFRMEAQNGLPPSDIDVGVELNKPLQNITTSKNQPGFIHPDKMN